MMSVFEFEDRILSAVVFSDFFSTNLNTSQLCSSFLVIARFSKNFY